MSPPGAPATPAEEQALVGEQKQSLVATREEVLSHEEELVSGRQDAVGSSDTTQELDGDVRESAGGRHDGGGDGRSSAGAWGEEHSTRNEATTEATDATSSGLLSGQLSGLTLTEPAIESATATEERVRSPTPPPPPAKDEKFLNSNLSINHDAKLLSRSPSPNRMAQTPQDDQDESDFNEKEEGPGPVDAGDAGDDSRSEIQSIMEQFEDGSAGPGMEEIMSPRLEMANPLLGPSTSHPPRRSSLEPFAGISPSKEKSTIPQQDVPALQTPPPPRTSSLHASSFPPPIDEKAHTPSPSSTNRPASIYKPPPPQPDPEPDLPFDFHRFLEQLRHRTADPVAKFLRSFLMEFGKKQWMVHEQVKIISDFLEFIAKKMAQCEVWRTVSDAEFDNAREGMEKLVMNRLYSQTFSPAIPPPEPLLGNKGRKKAAAPLVPGRRGQHQEDVERDEVLAQKVRIYSWVKEEHLDIKPVNEKGMKFLQLAQQELLKIKSYRAPRDKVICVLNCCKVIFGFLRNSQSDQSADSFVPLLIFTVLRANPDHLVSNVQYILRFRNQDKLGGEAGYYISSLMGAIQFIETLDRTSLTITDAEFEKNVEAAVSAIAERNSLDEQRQLQSFRQSPGMHVSEKSSLSRAEVTPRNSLEAERAVPSRSASARAVATTSTSNSRGESSRESSRTEHNHDNGGAEEENAAVAGLLRTIQKPLSTIGRIFSDDNVTEKSRGEPAPTPRLTPQPGAPVRRSSEDARPQRSSAERERQRQREKQQQQLSAEDAAARQASAEVEEARRIERQEHLVVVDTLAGMFPGLDREVISDVVRVKEGRVGLAVDACLALSN